MCLITFSWKNHPVYDLVVAANRDEFYKRPTAPAAFWDANPDLVAGKDLRSNGTWIGMTKSKRFAAITNYRDFDKINEKAPSRGNLTLDFLKNKMSPHDYLEQIKVSSAQFNLFNLLVGDENSLWYFNNVNFDLIELKSGLYGLSNGFLDEPWPKVEKAKSSLSSILKTDEIQSESLFDFLKNNKTAPDDELPDTGVPYGMEKGLSPLFIELPGYGTRCSTLIFSNNKKTSFIEKTYPGNGEKKSMVQLDF